MRAFAAHLGEVARILVALWRQCDLYEDSKLLKFVLHRTHRAVTYREVFMTVTRTFDLMAVLAACAALGLFLTLAY